MQITAHSDYALRLLIYLAVHTGGTPPTIKDAARRYNISDNHLAKVAQRLVQEGIVGSQRGRGGGLFLAKEPNEINIGSLIRKTENLELLECFGNKSECVIDGACILLGVLKKAQKAFLEELDQYTLADVVKNQPRLRESLKVVEG
jgi:Rrf2 family nitric oxide-sensitive transcriptional repressor